MFFNVSIIKFYEFFSSISIETELVTSFSVCKIITLYFQNFRFFAYQNNNFGFVILK